MRPQKDRIVKISPDVSYFKPRGIPLKKLEESTLTVDELESLRLADLLGKSHEVSGREMGVSRATFGRIVEKARRKVADALIHGKAIKIDGGNYKTVEEIRRFICTGCDHLWEEPFGTGKPDACPACDHKEFHRKK